MLIVFAVNTVGAVSLQTVFAEYAKGDVRSFLHTALEPLNIQGAVNNVCERIV